MATRTITTSIALDGEQKFKQQMSEVNRELRNLNSEMGLVEETFRGQANSTEALTAKGEILRREIEQQEEKINALEGALADATEAFGETDAKTDSYRQSLNRAQTELLKLNRELQDNERYLDEARRSADDCATSIDEFGREVRDVDLDNMGLDGFLDGLNKLKSGLVGGIIVGGAKELADTLGDVVSESEEYRRIMGTLEVSSQSAGYSAEDTAEIYDRLYAVLGDTQTAATATANLQALGLGQENLIKLTDLAIGAWATYGDSIPIDALAESINETIKTGEVTGNLADVLNWTGIKEDEFNQKLSDSVTYGDKVNTVLKTLSDEGLAKTGQAWIDQNQDIIDMNTSTGKMEQAMGKLGEVLAPVASDLQNFGAEVITNVVIPAIETAIEKITKFNQQLQDMHKDARNAGTSLTGQGYNFDFYSTEDRLSYGEASYNRVVEAITPATTADLQQVAAASVNAVAQSGGRASGEAAVIQLTLGDTRVVAETLVPDIRAAMKSNPEAINDG